MRYVPFAHFATTPFERVLTRNGGEIDAGNVESVRPTARVKARVGDELPTADRARHLNPDPKPGVRIAEMTQKVPRVN